MRTIVVTGANGYIGRHLVRAAQASGWSVVAATRTPLQGAEATLAYDLARCPDAERFPLQAPIVHLAAVTQGGGDAQLEQNAAQALLDVARARASCVIFVSSQVASADAPTPYGRSKHAIERCVLAGDGIVVRPGLVHGGAPGGVFAVLTRAARRSRWWPAIFPAPQVQPVHVEDLCRALLRVAEAPSSWRGRILRIGAPEGIAFDRFLSALAGAHGARLRLVPVPARLVRGAAALLARTRLRPMAERAQSLLAIPPMATRDDMNALGVALAPTLASYADRAARRTLVAESAAMLRYVLGRPASPGLVRRHVHAVERWRDAQPLHLPRLLRRWPALLRLLDQPRVRARRDELDWRLQAAAVVAEASREGATRFLALPAEGAPMGRLAMAVGAVLLDALARPAGVLLARSRIGMR